VLGSGVDLQTVSGALGHESTAITSRIYLHGVEALQDDPAARINALLGGSRPLPSNTGWSFPVRGFRILESRLVPSNPG
jgi:hypothetical protein